ncbi:hypothetical protein [Spirosoma gilvum]
MKQLIYFFVWVVCICQVEAQVYVRGYTRANGTYVQPHMRSSPDGNPYNNWSYPGNTNPYTGKVATGNPETYLENYYNRSNSSTSLSNLNSNNWANTEPKVGPNKSASEILRELNNIPAEKSTTEILRELNSTSPSYLTDQTSKNTTRRNYSPRYRSTKAKKIREADYLTTEYGLDSQLMKDYEKNYGPNSQFMRDYEKNYGPNSKFMKDYEKNYGPNSKFMKDYEKNYGPNSQFMKNYEKQYGPNSQFMKNLQRKYN